MNVPHPIKTITKDSRKEFQPSNTFEIDYEEYSDFLFELKSVRTFDHIRK